MIHSHIKMVIPPQKHGEALKILRSTAARNKILPGCMDSHIYEDLQDENVIVFEELWRSEEEMEQHLRSDEYRKVLLVVEMALERPEVRFSHVSSSSGIETIEKARATTGSGNRP
jgi:quinol monooxygenase YgiN